MSALTTGKAKLSTVDLGRNAVESLVLLHDIYATVGLEPVSACSTARNAPGTSTTLMSLMSGSVAPDQTNAYASAV